MFIVTLLNKIFKRGGMDASMVEMERLRLQSLELREPSILRERRGECMQIWFSNFVYGGAWAFYTYKDAPLYRGMTRVVKSSLPEFKIVPKRVEIRWSLKWLKLQFPWAAYLECSRNVVLIHLLKNNKFFNKYNMNKTHSLTYLSCNYLLIISSRPYLIVK